MAWRGLTGVLRRTLLRVQVQGDGSDAAVLGRFVVQGDQVAFAELVRRHGPMVLKTCRRVLGHQQDAEDAFQATFIVLARKAATVGVPESLAGWLHGVAYRTALQARKARYRQRAQALGESADVPDGRDRQAEVAEVREVLDAELASVPEKYRSLLVLCHLEGKSVAEAAQRLGLPAGTVTSWLYRGRELLRQRLERRGLALAAGTLAALLAQEAQAAAVPLALTTRTTLAATSQAVAAGAVSPQVATLVEAGMAAAFSPKLKACLAVLLLLGVLGGATLWSWSGTAAPVAVLPGNVGPETSLRLPSGRPLAVAFLPNGKGRRETIATATDVEVWDIAVNGTHQLAFRERGAGAISSDSSPDGCRLAVSYQDGSVRLIDLEAGRRIATLAGTSAAQGKLARTLFGPDSQVLAIMVPDSGITVWDLRKNQVRGRIALPGLAEASFTPDGAKLLGLDGRKYELRCWDAATLQEQPVRVPPGWKVAAVSSGGRSAVVVRTHAELGIADVGLLELADARVQSLFTLLHTGRLAFHLSPTADSLVYRDESRGMTCVWDLALGKNILVLKGFPVHVSYSNNGRAISLYEDDGGAKARFVNVDELRSRFAGSTKQ